jgi:hypothetical protein
MALFDFVKDIAGIGAAGASIAGMLGLTGGGTDKAVRRVANRQAAIAEALADPNSPMFQQARQQAMEQSRTAQLQALRDYMTAQQRQARRFSRQGNVSMYAMNPRRDEAISRQLAAMGQNETARADAAARQQLAGGLGAGTEALRGLGYSGESQRQTAKNRLVAFPSILEGVERIAGRLPQFGQPMESPVQSQSAPQQPATPAQTTQRFMGFR